MEGLLIPILKEGKLNINDYRLITNKDLLTKIFGLTTGAHIYLGFDKDIPDEVKEKIPVLTGYYDKFCIPDTEYLEVSIREEDTLFLDLKFYITPFDGGLDIFLSSNACYFRNEDLEILGLKDEIEIDKFLFDMLKIVDFKVSFINNVSILPNDDPKVSKVLNSGVLPICIHKYMEEEYRTKLSLGYTNYSLLIETNIGNYCMSGSKKMDWMKDISEDDVVILSYENEFQKEETSIYDMIEGTIKYLKKNGIGL